MIELLQTLQSLHAFDRDDVVSNVIAVINNTAVTVELVFIAELQASTSSQLWTHPWTYLKLDKRNFFQHKNFLVPFSLEKIAIFGTN